MWSRACPQPLRWVQVTTRIAQDPNPYLDLRAHKDRDSLQLANGPLLRAYCVLGLLCMMGSRPFL